MIFNPAAHEYTEDDGTPIPSVTQIIKAAGIIDDRFYNADARDRGSAVHYMAERYAAGFRHDNRGNLLASYEYVNSFAEWMSDYGVFTLSTECRVYHKINGKAYAGTYDILADIGGKTVLIDIKTGAKAKWHAVQLAAYAMAYPVVNGIVKAYPVNPDALAVLYLQAGGKYRYEKIPGSRMVEGIREFKEYLHGK
jgi:hypothetical protein